MFFIAKTFLFSGDFFSEILRSHDLLAFGPETMKNEGFRPPKNEGFGLPWWGLVI